MSISSIEIVPCPPERRDEALALVLCEIAPSHRREIAGREVDFDSFFVALRDGELRGAAWGQRQPGNSAVFWPPQLAMGEDAQTAQRLADAVVSSLDAGTVGMTQALLPSSDSELAPILASAGFRHLAELLYLTCEAERFPITAPSSDQLQFVGYDPSQRDLLKDLVERTYEGTFDCPALNGARRIEDVIAGYQATGSFRPENWRIALSRERPVGALLLTEHPAARHWELMYMGLVPEARGRGWGQVITRHAQWLAKLADVERIVLAVDAANGPAIAMYERAGFAAWDRRTVFVRILR